MMPLITLFSAPKPFDDPHVSLIQRNAIRSWTLLPQVEVFLLGRERGLAEAARELGVRHLPGVSCNDRGTPLVSSMVHLARTQAAADLLCIVNADMILLPDFLGAARQVRRLKDTFVLVGRRWDHEVTVPIDFGPGWEEDLRAAVLQRNDLHRPAGSDFFLFPKHCYADIPDFTIGRAGWDNWMIYKARREGWPVVDGTSSMMIIHQNHDYSHLPGAKAHYNHPESNENIRLAGGQAPIRYTILDSTHCLVDGKIVRPRMSYLRFMRLVELILRAIFFFLPAATIENVARPKRWRRRFEKWFGRG